MSQNSPTETRDSCDGESRSRRQFLREAAALAGATLAAAPLCLCAAEPASSKPGRLKVAAVVTEFTYRSHAHVILENFLEPYLFTSHVDAWPNLLSQPIDWHPMVTGIIAFAIYIAALMAAAWYVFRRKDILV